MRPVMRGARFALFQLESPLDTVQSALRLARAEGVSTMLDPAPAQPLSRELLELVDVLTPNETEAAMLLGNRAIAGRSRDGAVVARSRTRHSDPETRRAGLLLLRWPA